MNFTQSFISPQEIEELKKRRSMIQLLQERGIDVKRSGGNFTASCPFHDDKTPSFTIFPDNRGYCFGCGFRADAISLIQELDVLGFREACMKLGAHVSTGASHPRFESAASVSKHPKTSDLRRRANEAKDGILEEFTWNPADIWDDSPVRIDHGIEGQEPQIMLSTLFRNDEVIWIGGVHDSNRPGSEDHFRTVGKWLEVGQLCGTRTCPATFRPGERCRRNDRTVTTPYVVIEADEAIGKIPETGEEKDLNRAANAALIRWCREGLGMQLAAIVDSGNKSLHGWFKHPSRRCIEELVEIAPIFGIDSLLSKPTQPVRLPGFTNEKSNRQSRLLWLAECVHDR